MPTYDYECSECKHVWEMFHAMSAEPAKTCPKCGRKTAKRLIGKGAGVIFKGEGFYVNDYSKEKRGK